MHPIFKHCTSKWGFFNVRAEFARWVVAAVTNVSCKRNKAVVMFGYIMQQVLLSDIVYFEYLEDHLHFPQTLSINEFDIIIKLFASGK